MRTRLSEADGEHGDGREGAVAIERVDDAFQTTPKVTDKYTPGRCSQCGNLWKACYCRFLP